MFKLLAFLLILVILFGVETTRALFFGTLGFIFWAIIILVGIGLLVLGLKDDRTPEEKKKDEAELAERKKQAANTPIGWRGWLFAIVALPLAWFILWFIAHTLKI